MRWWAKVREILRVARVPVSVELGAGYGDDWQQVAKLVRELVELGVVGINLEDAGKLADRLVAKIEAIRATLGETPCSSMRGPMCICAAWRR